MTEKKRTYIAIDLKSFYASVECKERNRDPLATMTISAPVTAPQVSPHIIPPPKQEDIFFAS